MHVGKLHFLFPVNMYIYVYPKCSAPVLLTHYCVLIIYSYITIRITTNHAFSLD